MEFRKTEIEGVVEVFPTIYKDNRGYFFESFYQDRFREGTGSDVVFLQSNQSFSKKGVLRGLHFQKSPFQQAKLVRVVKGKVLDVAVDLRRNSPTFGKHFKCILEDVNNNMLFIPGDFAHGFLALEDSIFHYMCSNVYDKESEGGILWNDIDLNIEWGVEKPIITDKDLKLPPLEELKQTL